MMIADSSNVHVTGGLTAQVGWLVWSNAFIKINELDKLSQKSHHDDNTIILEWVLSLLLSLSLCHCICLISFNSVCLQIVLLFWRNEDTRYW